MAELPIFLLESAGVWSRFLDKDRLWRRRRAPVGQGIGENGVILLLSGGQPSRKMSFLVKRKHRVEVDLDAIRIRKHLFGNRSPISVLSSQWDSHCRIHSRDFSDCLRYHKNLANFLLPEPKPKQRRDMFQGLQADILHLIMESLDARSLARCGLVSKHWRQVAHSDALWVDKIAGCDPQLECCAQLWYGKQQLPPAALVPGLPRITAYGISMKDSKRTFITLDELCQSTWEFRFKDIAPGYWLNLDPSRRGESPMRRCFHADGSHTAGNEDGVWGGHESNYFVIDEQTASGSMERYVRINHWPRMVVSRTLDWGWELSNDFYIYRSLPPVTV